MVPPWRLVFFGLPRSKLNGLVTRCQVINHTKRIQNKNVLVRICNNSISDLGGILQVSEASWNMTLLLKLIVIRNGINKVNTTSSNAAHCQGSFDDQAHNANDA